MADPKRRRPARTGECWLCLACGRERCDCDADRAPLGLIHAWCRQAISKKKSSGSRRSDPHPRSVARFGHERPLMPSGRFAGRIDVSHPLAAGSDRWVTWGGCLACWRAFLCDEEAALTAACPDCRRVAKARGRVLPAPTPRSIRHEDGYPLVPCPCGAVQDRRPGALVGWEAYVRRALGLPVERFSLLEVEDIGGVAPAPILIEAKPDRDVSRMAWEAGADEEPEDDDDDEPPVGAKE